MRTSALVMTSAVLLAACGSRPPAGGRGGNNLAYLYGQESAALELRARIHHSAEDASTLHYRIRTRDLLYKSEGGGAPFRAQVRITCESYADRNARELLDSVSTLVKDVSEDALPDKELIGRMEMRSRAGRSYLLRITARDLHRGTSSIQLIEVDGTGASVRQEFLPMEAGRSLPYFEDHFGGPMALRLLCERYAERTLHVSHLRTYSRLPPPVFTIQTEPPVPDGPDSTFTVRVPADGLVAVDLQEPGIYHFRPDSTREEGYTLFILNDGHPYIQKADHMIPPLRYITSMQEYDRLMADPAKRQAVERFWLDAAGSKERARGAIKAYYQRVENANRHFTSLVEGWRTDRGLVHIIFGSPNTIYRSEKGETWIYGEESNLMSMVFQFTRRSSPYSDNDLHLQRDPQFKGAWYRNVESWRNGRVIQN